MSDPRTDRDVEQALREWMDQVAPHRPPTRLLEGTFTETMRTAQVRVYPWHRVGVGRLGRTAAGSGVRVVLVVIAVLLAAALAVALGGGGLRVTEPPIASPTPTPSAALTPSPTPGPKSSPSLPAAISVTPEASVPVQGPIAMVASGPMLWVMAPGRLDRIDPSTNAVTGSVAIGATTELYNGLAASADGLWATNGDASLLDRVDPTTLKVAAKIPAGLAAKGVLATADAVWVADVHDGSVLRFNPATNKVVETVTVGPTGTSGPNWLADGLGSIWVDIPNNGTIVRIDPVTNNVQATIPAPVNVTPCGGIAVGTAAVWVTSCSAGSILARVDPASNTVVATLDLRGFGYNPTLIDDVPWVSVDTGAADSGFLARIDPATNTIDRVLVPGPSFGGGGDIVLAGGSVWVVDGYNNTVLRLPFSAFVP